MKANQDLMAYATVAVVIRAVITSITIVNNTDLVHIAIRVNINSILIISVVCMRQFLFLFA